MGEPATQSGGPRKRSIGEDRSAAQSAIANARRERRRCQRRTSLFHGDAAFGDPAWDMLVELFIEQAAGRRVSTSSICIASGLPMSTALRLLRYLCDGGYLIREPDPLDGRRRFIRLGAEIAAELTRYFAADSEV